MAISFLQLERLGPVRAALVVPANGALVFDTTVSSAGTQISYDPVAGTIILHEAGPYYLDWYVAPYFGLTTDGSNWAVRTTLSQRTFIGSSHAKIAVTTGFAILTAAAGETVQLVNVSDGPIHLSPFVKSKAGIVAYSVGAQPAAP